MTRSLDPRSLKGPQTTAKRANLKGSDRNLPCPCGSGVKSKRCACTWAKPDRDPEPPREPFGDLLGSARRRAPVVRGDM